ncbi:MAG: DNA-binding protein WhiA [Firmicutes bacterium]|nr:DNA-binding protein WhiA [Bacillota bacterium]
MSFTAEVKNEIINNELSDVALISRLSSIISNSVIEENVRILTENANIARYIFDKFKDIFKINAKVVVRSGYNYNKNYIYILEFDDKVLLDRLGIGKNKIPENFIIDDDEMKKAYISGAFLMSGSINDPKKSQYHLELLFDNKEYALFFMNLLNSYYLNSKYLKRDNKYMVYIKESEKISDFLRIINTSNALFYYEDYRIYRDHKNMANRLNNCEQANVDKMIQAATNQINEIKLIRDNGCFELLDDKLKEVCVYRERYPESSLQELSEIISLETNNYITKSGLNHRLKKISEFANKIK